MYCFTVSNLRHIKAKNSRRTLYKTIDAPLMHRLWEIKTVGGSWIFQLLG